MIDTRVRIVEVLRKYGIALPPAPLDALEMAMDRLIAVHSGVTAIRKTMGADNQTEQLAKAFHETFAAQLLTGSFGGALARLDTTKWEDTTQDHKRAVIAGIAAVMEKSNSPALHDLVSGAILDLDGIVEQADRTIRRLRDGLSRAESGDQ